jgi:hypothetical protein
MGRRLFSISKLGDGVSRFRQCKSAKTGANGAFSKASNFEPGRPLDICPAAF